MQVLRAARAPQRLSDGRDATTQSRDLKDTKVSPPFTAHVALARGRLSCPRARSAPTHPQKRSKRARLEIFRCTLDLDQTVQAQTGLSLDLKFNPWDTAITFRPEWRSMSKTVFTQYDPFETWYTCQSDVWLDDVKTFYPRPMRAV